MRLRGRPKPANVEVSTGKESVKSQTESFERESRAPGRSFEVSGDAGTQTEFTQRVYSGYGGLAAFFILRNFGLSRLPPDRLAQCGCIIKYSDDTPEVSIRGSFDGREQLFEVGFGRITVLWTTS
jgi:hypothetical protein